MSQPLTRPHDPFHETEMLGEEIAQLSAQIQAATYRLLTLIREFDERCGWEGGFHSCAHWLNWRTGLNLGAAREKVRVARALANLPRISSAMSRGELSYSKVRALTRVATAENEEELLGFACAGTAHHVEMLVRSWRRVDRIAESERDEQRRDSRYLTLYPDEDGMWVIRGRLEPEVGLALEKAVDAARQRLYEEDAESRRRHGVKVEAKQQAADAVALVAESALSADLDPGTRGDRYQVVVHVEEEALEEGSEVGQAALESGVDVSAETSRRLACDAARVTMIHDAEGRTLDVGRRTRTIPPALRRALRHRDAGCRFPGCQVKVCDAHHVKHWADGGETRLDNLIELCRFHHRAVHEEGFRVEMTADGKATFHRPDGRLLGVAPAPPRAVRKPKTELEAALADLEVVIDAEAGRPSWWGERVDYGWAIDSWWEPRGEKGAGDVSAETLEPGDRQNTRRHRPT